MPEDLELLKVAFALYVTRKIVNADDTVHPDEVALVHKMFPIHKLEALGLMDPDSAKLTEKFHTLRKRAVEQLPHMLDASEKLKFIAWFREVCAADGHVDVREEGIVRKAAQLLGVPA